MNGFYEKCPFLCFCNDQSAPNTTNERQEPNHNKRDNNGRCENHPGECGTHPEKEGQQHNERENIQKCTHQFAREKVTDFEDLSNVMRHLARWGSLKEL